MAGFLAGLYQEDYDLLRWSLKDCIVEPQRKKLIPGFDDAKSCAENHGALGFGISGAGPTCFSLCRGYEAALEVEESVKRVFARHYDVVNSWACPLSQEGARIMTEVKK